MTRKTKLRWLAAGARAFSKHALVGLLFLWTSAVFDAQGQAPAPVAPSKSLAPFLDTFRENKTVRVVVATVSVPSAFAKRAGYLARPAGQERLPAVLLIFGEARLNDWMKQSTRELASVGYVVLALEGRKDQALSYGTTSRHLPAFEDEKLLGELSAAIRWLRRRSDVFPDRVGVAGWGSGGEQALALAGTTPLQACVLCDSLASDSPALLAGLRGTPLLVIAGGKDATLVASLATFRKALARNQIIHKARIFDKAAPGFMGPTERKEFVLEIADEAWVEIYEFLGKYVEDAPENSPFVSGRGKAAPSRKPIATIADLMRSVNGPGGTRGELIKALASPPSEAAQWSRARAYAALIAEAGALLEDRAPKKGAHSHWRDSAMSFATAAEEIVAAADKRDFHGARKGLKELAASCAACHERHR